MPRGLILGKAYSLIPGRSFRSFKFDVRMALDYSRERPESEEHKRYYGEYRDDPAQYLPNGNVTGLRNERDQANCANDESSDDN